MQRKQNALKRPQALASRIHAVAQRKHMMQEDHSSNHTCLGQNAHEDMDTGRLSKQERSLNLAQPAKGVNNNYLIF